MSNQRLKDGSSNFSQKNDQLLLVSFFIDKPLAVRKLEAIWASRNQSHSRYIRRRPKYPNFGSEKFGGSIWVMDPDNLSSGHICEINCPLARGMLFSTHDRSLLVASHRWVRKIEFGKTIKRIGNWLFSDLHSISESLDSRILVTASGTDSIVEIDTLTEKETWDWLATENSYNRLSSGKTRRINRGLNYQMTRVDTTEQATHINSCLRINQDFIIAVLFHQGRLIKIDTKNGEVTTLLNGLKSPHSIRKREKGGYILCDTRGNRVLLLDSNFKISKVITGNYKWVQDAVELDDGSMVVGDSNNNRILKVTNSGRIIDLFNIPAGTRKLSSFLTIKKNDLFNISGCHYPI